MPRLVCHCNQIDDRIEDPHSTKWIKHVQEKDEIQFTNEHED